MGGVEILFVFAAVMGVTFVIWLFVNANNSEYDTETDSTEDSRSEVTPTPSPHLVAEFELLARRSEEKRNRLNIGSYSSL